MSSKNTTTASAARMSRSQEASGLLPRESSLFGISPTSSAARQKGPSYLRIEERGLEAG